MPYSELSPIMNDKAVLDEQRVITHILLGGTKYTQKDVQGFIIPAYKVFCAKTGIDINMAIAQMIHETGKLTSWWSQRPRRNPAGIGVNGVKHKEQPIGIPVAFQPSTGLWAEGLSFPSWEQAVEAHVGRLVAFAVPRKEWTEQQQHRVAFALGWRELPDTVIGSAPRLRQLGKVYNSSGHGWADPGDNYGRLIATIANIIAGV